MAVDPDVEEPEAIGDSVVVSPDAEESEVVGDSVAVDPAAEAVVSDGSTG